ncbi:MAG: family 16 glycoside hydrolase [Saprospiraceae bacterium]|nr:family 16 glycoside hydrolase [Saprospiraceae bacterium]
MKKVLLLSTIAITLFSIGCKRATQADYTRAHDPWVFRSVLDSIPRMLTVALNDNLWAAYSAQTGALYKVWKGGVNLDGAVYTTAHGPQPSTLGDAYFENDFFEPWMVIQNNKAEQPNIQFRGHRFQHGQVTINYELQLSDGVTIKVHETPEYVTNKQGLQGFERTFTLENVPSGAQVLLKANLNSIALESNILTEGGAFQISKTEAYEKNGLMAMAVEGLLTLNPKGKTVFTTYFVKEPMIENQNKIVGAEEEDLPLGMRLISRNDCKTCHNTFVKTIGPSYVDVAKKYANTSGNVAMLVGKVINGGAGVWGEAAMTAHPNVPESDITEMVKYIMELDAEEEAVAKPQNPSAAAVSEDDAVPAAQGIAMEDLLPGAFGKVLVLEEQPQVLADINFNQKPTFSGVFQVVSMADADFEGLMDNFAVEVSGYLNIPKTNNYVFRLSSDDGSRLILDNRTVINHDGLHGAEPRDAELILAAGYHPFKIQYFQGGGGKVLRLEWSSPDIGEFQVVPASAFRYNPKTIAAGSTLVSFAKTKRIPGDKTALTAVHPSYDLSQARPHDFTFKVGGMDFLPDGRLVVSTWESDGGVYIIDGVETGDPSKMSYKKIATGLAEPLGLKVVDGEIYIMQKQELTKLIDHNRDEIIDEYYTLCNNWRVSSNFHEFGFGLAYKNGYFYAALATAILPGGASAKPQIPDRGKAIRINKETGKLEFIAQGLRTPNGVGIGVDNEIFIADNQGDWLPSSKIVHVSQGAFFGSRSVDSVGTANLPVKLPVVWLPQDEIGNSPSTPLALNDGPYKGQMIHGEVTHGGVKRVFVEKINGEYQGVVFRFIQGLEAGVNRMVWGPDGALYIGGVGNPGNWQQTDKEWYGLQRLKHNGKSTFEMLAVRAKSNGVEIEFTQALAEGLGWNSSDYIVQQWWYEPTPEYGGPKKDLENLKILSVNVSNDRKKVFLELQGMKPNHLVYLRLPYSWTSDTYQELWSTEAWYTMNQIPTDNPGFKTQAPDFKQNTLSETERKEGFKLLFDGNSLNGWRNFNKKVLGSSWIVQDDAILLDAKKDPNGNWQSADGGDITTDKEYEDFDLRLEWKIEPCGNSGIIYRAVESSKYEHAWHTGPEMQIQDDACHPDGKTEKHQVGDIYDMIGSKYTTAKPSGQWNQVRIVVKGNKIEQWQNGRKIVETEVGTNEWNKLIAESKWKDYPDFGKAKKGHIVLQDHGNRVWFRNIRIKEF